MDTLLHPEKKSSKLLPIPSNKQQGISVLSLDLGALEAL